MNFNNRAAQEKIIRQVKNSLPKLKVKSGKCRYNYKCQMNAVHEALKNKHSKIAMCICIDEDRWACIHFINYHKGKYKDNTLGQWTDTQDYYFVRWIEFKDFYNVDNIFREYRKQIQSDLGWWLRLTSNDSF